MTAASNSEARKRLADPTPHTDPTAAAVRAAQAEALREAADEWEQEDTDAVGDWLRDRADRLATDTAAPEGEVGTGADEGATGQDTGTAWVTRSTDCPEAPAQAHLPAAPVAVEGVETVETLAEVLAAHRSDGWAVTTGDGYHMRCSCGVDPRADRRAELPLVFAQHVAEAIAPFLAARIVQVRAGEGALRERIEALIQKQESWYAANGGMRVIHVDTLHAALDPEATT